MKKPKAPIKGQRPISSFLFKPKPDQIPAQPLQRAGGAAGPDEAPEAVTKTTKARQKPPNHAVPETTKAREQRQPPAKRPRPSAPTAVDPTQRHARWQHKLLGDDGTGVPPERIRSQAALEEQQALEPPGAQGGKAGKFTPLEQQVAQLQAAHPDCVLAIETGYKYRFFGRDAEIASQVLGIFAYPDRNFLTAGVPTHRIDWHVRRLAAAGLKVGIVRQTESAAIKAAGDNRYKPFDRQLTAMVTRATLEAGELAALGRQAAGSQPPSAEDADAAADGGHVPDASWSNEQRSAYLVCVVEEPAGTLEKAAQKGGQGNVTLALVAVETSTGDVLYSQFTDSAMRPALESKLLYAAPSELLIVQPVSAPTQRLLASFGAGSGGLRTETVSGAEYREGGALAAVTAFYSGASAAAVAGGGDVSAREGERERGAALDAVMALPPLVVRALAHAVAYLQPFKLAAVLHLGASFREFSAAAELALSPNTLRQLEILRNSDDGSERGSLLWLMDRTLTAPGSRLMRHWVSRPLREVEAINERLDAVEELLRGVGGSSDAVCLSRLPAVLRTLPDLERTLTRALHGTSSPAEFLLMLRTFSELHAQLGLQADLEGDLEGDLQGDLQVDLQGAVGPMDSSGGEGTPGAAFTGHVSKEAAPPCYPPTPQLALPGLRSQLLRRLLLAAADLRCAAVARQTLACIDADAAAANDKLRLFADDARFADVAACRADVDAAEHALQALRPQLAAALNVRSVAYVSLQNQGDFLVEVPVDLEKRAPKDWERISSTKKFARFRPPAVKKALTQLELAREQLAATAAAAWTRLLSQFSQHYALLRAAVRALAALDCLLSFAALAGGASGGYVRPHFVPADAPPQLHITAGRHPVLDMLLEGAFVPNDTDLGGGEGEERCAVITGPNMGGKSCLIRQAALIACMAQAGSFVPAQAVTLHAFDAIFTRMGAADNIALGRSTFLEELSEASTILASATSRSLIIIDELGRGTSTRDGLAVAQATLEHIVRSVKALTLFVTHYPELTRLQRRLHGALGCYYMAYVAETQQAQQEETGGGDGGAGPSPAAIPKVTFLYRLTPGVAQASFGLNVAVMAGLPQAVVQRAAEKAEEIEAADAQGRHHAMAAVARRVRDALEAAGSGGVDARALVQLQQQVQQALETA